MAEGQGTPGHAAGQAISGGAVRVSIHKERGLLVVEERSEMDGGRGFGLAALKTGNGYTVIVSLSKGGAGGWSCRAEHYLAKNASCWHSGFLSCQKSKMANGRVISTSLCRCHGGGEGQGTPC